jgi:putative copper export protein
MSSDLVLAVPTRWAAMAALAALVGGLVLDVVVLPGEGSVADGVRRRLGYWNLGSVAVLLVTSVGELVLRARTMSGGGSVAALAAIPVVLRRTHFGIIWISRCAGLGLLSILAAKARRARVAALVLSVGVALTSTLSGHAADWGDSSLTAMVDWVHVVASAAWTGGLFCLAMVVLPAARSWPPELLGTAVRRFSALAGWCLLAVIASGIYNACVELPSLGALWTTRYGEILAAKLVVVVGIIGFGAANRFSVVPALAPGQPSAARARAPAGRLVRFVTWEATLALVAFGCAALLTHAAPPRHPGHGAQPDVGTTARLHDTGRA